MSEDNSTSSSEIEEAIHHWFCSAFQQNIFSQEMFFNFLRPTDLRSLPRAPKRIPNYTESVWFRMLRDEREKLDDAESHEAKTFRRRFRVPYIPYLQ